MEQLGFGLYWASVFIGGSYLPSICIGVIVVLLALLTLFKQVRIGTLPSLDEVKANFEAKRLKNKIFYSGHADGFDCFSISKNDP